MKQKPDRDLARLKGFDFCIEDHGLPFLTGSFEYESGSSQGFGYSPDIAFLMRLMCAVGATTLRGINGKSAWVTHTHDDILKVEPLHKGDGEPFDIEKWKNWVRERGCQASAYEMRTGKKP